MNKRELLVEELDGRLFAAVLKGGKLIDLYADARDRSACWASLYLGNVMRIDQRLDAAFVDLGNGLTGFLQAKHVRLPGLDPAKRVGIGEMLKAGQKILVQVKSEANPTSLHESHKLPRLTMQLYVPGQSLIYGPNAGMMNISKQITNEKVLALSVKLQTRGGWIIQPSAQHAEESVLVHEANQLMRAWRALEAERAQAPDQPRLLSQGPNAMERALLDYGANQFDSIDVGDRRLLDAMQAWSARFEPKLAESKKLTLFRPDRAGQSLLDLRDVTGAIEAAGQPMVELAGGGNLIIEQPHALAVIDVNRGGAESVASLNMEAATEATHQIHIRNMTGAILIDFVSMKLKTDRARLITLLENLLQDDRGSAQVHGFTRLGIIEITRKRRTASLAEKLQR